MRMIGFAAVAFAVVVGPAAFAQTFLVPSADCGDVTLHVTGGDGFPKLGEKIAKDRIARARVWIRPKLRLEPDLADGPRSTSFDAKIPDEGVVVAAVGLKPEVRGGETWTEHAKAFIFCGPATPIADWQRSIGLGLEIYPQGWNGPRPHLKPGDPMRFIVVDKATGKLIPDLPMDLHGAGGLIAHGVLAEHGGMNFPYQAPGRYMVVARYRRPDPQQPEHWLVDTSTLTFDIK